MPETLLVIVALIVLGAVVLLFVKLTALNRAISQLSLSQVELVEQKQHALVGELRDNLDRHGDRLTSSVSEGSERLRGVVSGELKHARDAMHVLQLSSSMSCHVSRGGAARLAERQRSSRV
jgi:hypothetical protein